jgi:5'-deoxynucleotidase YfbR-like HD superfamily hydrolase
MTPLRQIIRANWIDRYHATPEIPGETVGHHHACVAQIIARLHWPDLAPAKLLTWAIHHDSSECVTGDVPAWAKDAHPGLRTILDGIARRWEQENGIAYDLDPQEARMAELADKLAVLFHVAQKAPALLADDEFKRTRAQVEGLAWQIGQPVAARVQQEIRGLM